MTPTAIKPKPLGTSINHTLSQMLLLGEGPAVDTSRAPTSHGRGGHGKHGTTTIAPSHGAEKPLAVVWAERLRAIHGAMERDLENHRTGAHARPAKSDQSSRQRERERQAILRDGEGQSPVFLAFVHGWTEDGVRKLRTKRGLDAMTGERKPDRPLTAPAREALAAYET